MYLSPALRQTTTTQAGARWHHRHAMPSPLWKPFTQARHIQKCWHQTPDLSQPVWRLQTMTWTFILGDWWGHCPCVSVALGHMAASGVRFLTHIYRILLFFFCCCSLVVFGIGITAMLVRLSSPRLSLLSLRPLLTYHTLLRDTKHFYDLWPTIQMTRQVFGPHPSSGSCFNIWSSVINVFRPHLEPSDWLPS